MLPPPHFLAAQARLRRSAFSVIELLVAAAVIAVLLALLSSAGNSVMQQTRKSKCLSNLRQIGVAFSLYVGENNGKLPGPMTDGQRLGYSLVYSDQFHIPRILGKYLNLAPATAETQFASSLSCLSWFNQLQPGANASGVPAFILSSVVVEGEVLHPFGRTKDLLPPMRYAALPKPGVLKAMIESDAQLAPSWAQQLPSRPVHGGAGRHTLFFDWHAEHAQ